VEPEHRLGVHPVSVGDGGPARIQQLGARRLGCHLEDRHRAGRLTAWDGVDHDQGRVAAVEQFIREVDPADPDVGDVDDLGQLDLFEPPDDLDPEPVVSQQDVADPGDQDARSRRHRTFSVATGSTSSGEK
jgi:hypothetical protein